MTAPQKFRSAINGFNREDVVTYIEYSNARHESELSQLREELDRARREIAELSSQSTDLPAADPVISTQMTELTEKYQQLEKENAALREQLTQVIGQRDEALNRGTEAQGRLDAELEAYRRAERTERLAQARASRMYDLANGMLADTAAQLDTVASALGNLADAAMERVQQLQDAVADSKQVLSNAAASLSTIAAQEIGE